MMKRFIKLLELEYDGMFFPLGIIIAVMAVLQLTLFGIAMRDNFQTYAPLSYLIDNANISIVFAIAYVCLLVLMGARLVRNYTPSKSIYVLLTLPIKRGHVYLAKLTATLLAGLVLMAAQMLLLLLLSALSGTQGGNAWLEAPRRNADLYLSLLDVRFLRMIFPPEPFALVFSVFGFFGSICITLYCAVMLKASRKRHAIILAAVWLALMLFTFPLSDNTRGMNIIKLGVMIIIVFATNIKGIKLFESGEVAA